MRYLSLDRVLSDVTDDDRIEFDLFKFNGGERHVKIASMNCVPDAVTIEVVGDCNVMDILLANDALRRVGVKRVELLMPYVPYARQDRVMCPGEPLSAKVFADVINAAVFDKVHTLDNHSSVVTALLDECCEIDPYRIYHEIFKGLADRVLICPDAGAMKRVYSVAKEFGISDVVECSKRRDVRTGEILETVVYADDLNGRDCYIVDDICDGGRTFVEIAKVLKQKNAGKIVLYVSHGIFSQGLAPFVKLIDKVVCTTLFPTQLKMTTEATAYGLEFDMIFLRKEDLR